MHSPYMQNVICLLYISCPYCHLVTLASYLNNWTTNLITTVIKALSYQTHELYRKKELFKNMLYVRKHLKWACCDHILPILSTCVWSTGSTEVGSFVIGWGCSQSGISKLKPRVCNPVDHEQSIVYICMGDEALANEILQKVWLFSVHTTM